MMTPEAYLEEIYTLAAENKIEAAGYRIFDYIDRCLLDGEFEKVDQILELVDVEKLPSSLMRSFLVITMAASNKLSARISLYKRIHQRMVELKGEEKTKKVIGNLL